MLSSKISRFVFHGPKPLLLASRKLTNDVATNFSSVSPPKVENASLNAESNLSKGINGWQIMAAVCVTRHPVICPPMSPVEHAYSDHLNKLEVEHSLLSDFELKIMEESARRTLGEKEMEEVGEAAANEQSALELLDVWKGEKEQFDGISPLEYHPAPSAVGVSPSRQVVLAQKYQIGSQELWLLPQGPWKPGETLRQTSERIVAECCDPSLCVRVVGNAPIGFYKYKYPKELRSKGYIGAKVFFYRGQVSFTVRKSVSLLLSGGRGEQAWLTREQLGDKMQKSYVTALSQFLVNDD